MVKHREATSQELKQLRQSLRSDYAPDDAATLVKRAAIAVFDDYRTSIPGYFGKVMVVVFDDSPGEYWAYTWNNKGKLIRQNQVH